MDEQFSIESLIPKENVDDNTKPGPGNEYRDNVVPQADKLLTSAFLHGEYCLVGVSEPFKPIIFELQNVCICFRVRGQKCVGAFKTVEVMNSIQTEVLVNAFIDTSVNTWAKVSTDSLITNSGKKTY